jgi:hypothetical protein
VGSTSVNIVAKYEGPVLSCLALYLLSFYKYTTVTTMHDILMQIADLHSCWTITPVSEKDRSRDRVRRHLMTLNPASMIVCHPRSHSLTHASAYILHINQIRLPLVASNRPPPALSGILEGEDKAQDLEDAVIDSSEARARCGP